VREVAIVGRPNIGKSTLFNRLVGSRDAIVADVSGVTRDVKSARVQPRQGKPFMLLDTGGLWSGDEWETKIFNKVADALRNANLVLFAVDGREGVTDSDRQIAQWLRRTGAEVLLVATKIDDERHTQTAEYFDLFSLGFGEPLATAAEHSLGTFELLEAIQQRLPEPESEHEEDRVRVSIIGRPNVGKSSILNSLVGTERVIVADEPGTTRDSIDVEFSFAGRPFVLVDTAGIRRKPSEDLEYYSKLRSEQALLKAEVSILVIDPFEFGDHEMRLANLALEAGKPVVLAINKWDLVSPDDRVLFLRDLDQDLAHISFAPRVFTSALEGTGLHELLAAVIRVYDTSRQRIATGQLNSWIDVWTQRLAPPNFQGRPLRLLYATQADIAPPTFVFSVNNEKFMTRPYEQYLRNRIREDLGLAEIPFRMIFKARGSSGGKRVRLS
jgi:GTP-binding protein